VWTEGGPDAMYGMWPVPKRGATCLLSCWAGDIICCRNLSTAQERMDNVPRGLWDTGDMLTQGERQTCNCCLDMYAIFAEMPRVGADLHKRARGVEGKKRKSTSMARHTSCSVKTG